MLFAGRLELERGLPYLLQALTQISPLPKLVVAGDGTLRSTYEQMASDLNLADCVQFVGWLTSTEMELAYQRCSILVIPSICPEAFGKVGVEALTHSRPVVAFDVRGISDWLHDGVNGFLIEPRNVQLLAAKMDQLLRDREKRISMGKAGQAIGSDRYKVSQHLKTLLSLFQLVSGD